jgi:hypothetical protein
MEKAVMTRLVAFGTAALLSLCLAIVAERVVRIAPCPVLTVRDPEHEFVLPDALVAVSAAQKDRR